MACAILYQWGLHNCDIVNKIRTPNNPQQKLRGLESHSCLFIFVKSNKIVYYRNREFYFKSKLHLLPAMKNELQRVRYKTEILDISATISQLHGWIIYVSDCYLAVFTPYIYAHKPIHLSAMAFYCTWKMTSNNKNIRHGTDAIYTTLCFSSESHS